MVKTYQPLLTDFFLRTIWDQEYENYKNSGVDNKLLSRLKNWAEKDFQKETTAEQNFVQQFFVNTWGYNHSGSENKNLGYTINPKYTIQKGGIKGGIGGADLALGYFGREDMPEIPQILCEFKDIHSNLDSPQNRKDDKRTPIQQCATYMREARAALYGNEKILPTWGIVSDMNEFRLYYWNNMPIQYQRFIIKPLINEDNAIALINETDESSFQRFLFFKIFRAENLLSEGGKSILEQILKDQWIKKRDIENSFYKEYRAFREKLYSALIEKNPNFSGTKSKLVKLAQRILDRLIFIMYCEDMGKILHFPPLLLRDMLREIAGSQFYQADDNIAWEHIKTLFQSMADGSSFAGHPINRFNGGLYTNDPEIDHLTIPTYVFCAKRQEQNLNCDKSTLLYLSSIYNFGVSGASQRHVIDLYTLGHIFEQSITELEIKVAEVDNKPSIGKLTKRKRDGVFYTPEWVTRFIVEETIGNRLNELKKEVNWDDTLTFSTEDLAKRATDNRTKVANYLKGLMQYKERLKSIKIIDPACGSGAFLIQSLDYLINEHIRIISDFNRFNSGQLDLFDQEIVVRDILSNNIYGVDINPESIEITRLALWLHTAIPDRPLTNLDKNIRCGNSLVSSDFYLRKPELSSQLSPEQKDRVNAFDYEKVFPDVFNRDDSGFDCVVGNPPYVKLQYFRKVEPESTEYLLNATNKNGNLLYESTQTGNFDLYLPFIERGISLLNKKGRMGYIAPSLWLKNEYGKSLRKKIHRNQNLDKWLDFKSYQVFEESITYTALQFYKKSPSHIIHFAIAPNGGTNVSDWENMECQIKYDELKADESWAFLLEQEKKLFEKLQKKCVRLDQFAKAIIVGIQTSADHIYHLKKVSQNKYLQSIKLKSVTHKTTNMSEVEIEDEIMHPLISGEETKRYETPKTDTYLLFPYDISDKKPRLYTQLEMERLFPKCWAYLKQHEKELRCREYHKFDNDQWYQFGRNQNIDKQEIPKLVVPRLVQNLFCTIDSEGKIYIDNVDVGGIITHEIDDLYYIAGLLNHPLINYIFIRISKPFQNNYYSANKQFIAPLPIAIASTKKKAEIAGMSQKLQSLHSSYSDKLALIKKRLITCDVVKHSYNFIWQDIHDINYWKLKNPQNLQGKDITIWAKQYYQQLIDSKLNYLKTHFVNNAVMTTDYHDGELKLLINNTIVLNNIFLSEADGNWIQALWKYLCRTIHITENTNPKTIIDKLCTIYKTENNSLIEQILFLTNETDTLELEIEKIENTLNNNIFDLYELDDTERNMVIKG